MVTTKLTAFSGLKVRCKADCHLIGLTSGVPCPVPLIPTVALDGKQLTDEQARQRYLDTGEYLGVFRDRGSADAYLLGIAEAQKQRNHTRQMDKWLGAHGDAVPNEVWDAVWKGAWPEDKETIRWIIEEFLDLERASASGCLALVLRLRDEADVALKGG